MPAARAIEFHLGPLQPSGEAMVYSSFRAGLRNARKHTGRSEDTGAVIRPDQTNDWLGALGYMILLEQIGKCFRPAGAPRAAPQPTAAALILFDGVEQRKALAVYALRCAFAHDFGLQNRNPRHAELQHRFRLVAVPGEELVTLPSTPWDGDRSNNAQVTQINLFELAEATERVAEAVMRSAANGTLDVILEGGSDELLSRYSIGTFPRSAP